MIPDSEFAPVALRNGDRLNVVVPTAPREPITLMRKRGSRVVDHLDFPYPKAGLGGGGSTPSGTESLILFSYFSGQSEEAYRVISLDGPMQQVCFCDYLFGEAASYCFSPDERTLLMALPTCISEWWLPWEDDELETDASGRRFLDFGVLRLHEIHTGAASHHVLRVFFSDGWHPDETEYDPDLAPQLEADGRIGISLPWGMLRLAPPVPGIVELHL
jgi:hypothetical protein